MHSTTRMLLLLAALTGTVAPTLAYAQKANPPKPAAAVKVLATVNGKPITTADVQFAMMSAGTHQGQETPSDSKAVLDEIILQELAYQKAKQLGIDADPGYQEDLRRIETEVIAFKRKKLTELFLWKNTQNIQISDEQARAYFAANAAHFRTVYNLSQILRRNEGLIKEDMKELEQGTPFEKVAAKQFPNLPSGMNAPWILGDMHFNQLPAEWKSVVSSLKKGQHSSIIRGPNNRFWIIKLNDKREDKNVSFESAKPMVIQMMKEEKAEQSREALIRDLRNKAKIVYTK
jgi:EpsD family peptidyl-prolyl cis-trans isomerase